MAKKTKKKYKAHQTNYKEWVTPEGLLKIEAWARDGLIDEQIAHNMGIHRSTLAGYKNKYPEIKEALRSGKEEVDIQVENSLLKRALGYEYQETTRERVKLSGPDGEVVHGMKVTKIVTKQVVPDVTAQIFWLKNRKPKEWRDKQDIEHSGEIGAKIEFVPASKVVKPNGNSV